MRTLHLTLTILIASAGLADEQLAKREQLDQKLAELDRLQRDIDQLRVETRTPQQIIVNVKMIEVSATKLRKLGADFDRDALVTSQGSLPAIVESTTIRSVLDGLLANNVAKVLADPMLVVTSGRPASLRIGGDVPQPAVDGSPQINFITYGTELEVVATTLGDDKVRLDVRPRVLTLDESHAMVVNGQKILATKVREMDTSCELRFGKSIVLCGQSCERVESCTREGKAVEQVNEIRTLVVVTPELVGIPGAPHAISDASTKPAAYEAPR